MPYLQTESGKIYYECYGSSGPVLILLHGLASSSRLWIRQIRTLQRCCRIYVLDFPGHGRSDRQEKYRLENYADQVKTLMDACGLQKASLAGISMGCSVALIFAARYPGRVDKLILEGPIGGYHPWWHPVGWADRLFFLGLPFVLECSVALFGYRATAHWLNTFGVKAKRNFKVLESVQHKTDHKAIRQILWDSACAPYAGELERIIAPTLLIRGSNDPMPRRFVEYIQTHLSWVSYVEVPETRHLVALEKPREFNDLIKNFLGLAPRRRRKPVRHQGPEKHSG